MQSSSANADCSHHDEVTDSDSFPFSLDQGCQCFCVCTNEKGRV